MKKADIIIIGGGIAGCSAAAQLSSTASVIVLEQEQQPGYHSTGRSAATLAPFYGPPVIQQLTALSTPFLNTPPQSVSAQAFTSPRGEMILVGKNEKDDAGKYNGDTQALIDESLGHGMQQLSMADAQQLVALLKPHAIDQVLYTDKLLSIDVDSLHQSTIKRLRQATGEIICDSPVTQLEYSDNLWRVTTGKPDATRDQTHHQTHYEAPIVINAAGAWADEIAKLAGLPPTGMQPKRRSAALIPFIDLDTDATQMHNWPMLLDSQEHFYSIPFGSGLLVSPADETPVDPHDVWPEDIDLATGIDRFQQVIDYDVQTINHRWAGLRTFVADGEPVVGFDPLAKGFFWLAGQGGYGIQTSPALAMLCDYLVHQTAGEHTAEQRNAPEPKTLESGTKEPITKALDINEHAEAFERIAKRLSPARLTR